MGPRDLESRFLGPRLMLCGPERRKAREDVPMPYIVPPSSHLIARVKYDNMHARLGNDQGGSLPKFDGFILR